MEGLDVAGDAVDEEPGAWLPAPAGLVLGGEGVVEAQGAADGEAAVGDVVGVAEGPLALAVVYEQGADLEGGSVFVLLIRGDVRRGVGDAADGGRR